MIDHSATVQCHKQLNSNVLSLTYIKIHDGQVQSSSSSWGGNKLPADYQSHNLQPLLETLRAIKHKTCCPLLNQIIPDTDIVFSAHSALQILNSVHRILGANMKECFDNNVTNCKCVFQTFAIFYINCKSKRFMWWCGWALCSVNKIHNTIMISWNYRKLRSCCNLLSSIAVE